MRVGDIDIITDSAPGKVGTGFRFLRNCQGQFSRLRSFPVKPDIGGNHNLNGARIVGILPFERKVDAEHMVRHFLGIRHNIQIAGTGRVGLASAFADPADGNLINLHAILSTAVIAWLTRARLTTQSDLHGRSTTEHACGDQCRIFLHLNERLVSCQGNSVRVFRQVFLLRFFALGQHIGVCRGAGLKGQKACYDQRCQQQNEKAFIQNTQFSSHYPASFRFFLVFFRIQIVTPAANNAQAAMANQSGILLSSPVLRDELL